MRHKNLFVFGTRPELIKMWPVINKTKDRYVVCTGQHKELLDKNLVTPDLELDLMKPGRRLLTTMDTIMGILSWVFESQKPGRVIVLGDTATAFAASLAAFHADYPIAHIEAGLRTWDKKEPFPEEVYRQFISSVADIHFAPTQTAANNLLPYLREGIDIYVTGNTVIDAVKALAPKTTMSKDILITMHRRESPVEEYAKALRILIQSNPAYTFKVIIHPNQTGQALKKELACLAELKNLYLLPPVGYLEFLQMLASCYMVMTDSGGLQEEAPALDKPVLVLRKRTERTEGIGSTAALVSPETMVEFAERLMYGAFTYQSMAQAENPYGDGHAGSKIAEVLNR